MNRRYVLTIAVVAIFAIGGWVLVQGRAQPPAGKGAGPAFSGKPILLQAKDQIYMTLEKAELRQLGGRDFVVGREMKKVDDPYKLTNPFVGGVTVWVPLDTITRIVELEPVKADK